MSQTYTGHLKMVCIDCQREQDFNAPGCTPATRRELATAEAHAYGWRRFYLKRGQPNGVGICPDCYNKRHPDAKL